MRRLPALPALLLPLLLLGTPLPGAGQDPFAGTFRGDGLTLVLRSVGGGEYLGEAEEDGIRFAVQGRGSGSLLEGWYSAPGVQAPFRATLEGNGGLVVEAAGERYSLVREGGGGGGESGASGGAEGTPDAPPSGDEIDVPEWGLRFRIPPGWQLGEALEDSWILVSASVPGALIVADLEAGSMEELAALAGGEIQAEGIRLTPRGVAEPLGDAGLGVGVTGVLGEVEVEGYMVGVLSPHGSGITVLAAAAPGTYGPTHRDAARELGASARFRPPPGEGDTGWWQAQLAGQRLVRMGQASTGGGGSRSRTTVTLCRDGRGGYLYTYSMAMDVGGVFGNSAQRDEAEGRWEVVARGGQPLLVLRTDQGAAYEWTLSMENQRIHLDGRQYLRDSSPC